MTRCNGGLHGALFCNYLGEWSCLLCGKKVDHNELCKFRDKRRNRKWTLRILKQWVVSLLSSK